MNDTKIIEFAYELGFSDAAIIGTEKIVFDAAFRPYCEENLCGQYGINYSCPPDCGTPEQMKARVLSHKKALVLRTEWNIDINDSDAVKKAKKSHNDATMRLIDTLKSEGCSGFMIGSSGCSLCTPCALASGGPCKYPDKRFSCMSAYCIYVKNLAHKCSMEYDYKNGKLALFGMYVFD